MKKKLLIVQALSLVFMLSMNAMEKTVSICSEKRSANDYLVDAVRSGDYEAAREALKLRANVNAWESHRTTVLMAAIKNGNASIAKLLLDNGASVGAFDEDGMLAIDYAKRRLMNSANDREDIRQLLPLILEKMKEQGVTSFTPKQRELMSDNPWNLKNRDRW